MRKTLNKARRKYRRNCTVENLQHYIILQEIFASERNYTIYARAEKRLSWMLEEQNIWKFVTSTFHSFSLPYHRLLVDAAKIINFQKIADTVADYFEKHFQAPKHDTTNPMHKKAIQAYEEVEYTQNIPPRTNYYR